MHKLIRNILSRRISLLVAGLLLTCLSLVSYKLVEPVLRDLYYSRQASVAQSELNRRELQAEALLKEVRQKDPLTNGDNAFYFYEKCRKLKIPVFIYANNQLVFWTTNEVLPRYAPLGEATILERLRNGFYLQKNTSKGDFTYIALIPIRYRYAFQNQYLQNSFPLLPQGKNIFKILEQPVSGAYNLHTRSNDYVLSLEPAPSGRTFLWLGWFFVAGMLMVFIYFHLTILADLRRRDWKKAVLYYAIPMAILLFLWKILRQPETLFSWELFSPGLYASSDIFRSLGDLLIFTAISCWSVYLFFQARLRYELPAKWTNWLPSLGIPVFFLFANFIENVVKSLINDSSISFDLGNIYSLGLYSFIGFLITFSLLAIFFSMMQWFFRVLRMGGLSGPGLLKTLIQWVAFTGVLLILPHWLFPDYFTNRWLPLSFIFTVLSLGCFFYLDKPERSRLQVLTFLSVLAAFYATFTVTRYNEAKQLEKQRILASRLVSERDAVAEYLFQNVYENLQRDAELQSFFYNPQISQAKLRTHIEQKYFSGYFSKYELEVSSFSFSGVPFKGNFDKSIEFFNGIFSGANVTPLLEDERELYFINNYTGLPLYIAPIKIVREGRFLGTVMLQFHQKAFYEESVYPELVLSENLQHQKELEDYSYAIYREGILLTRHGDFPYPQALKGRFAGKKAPREAFESLEQEGFMHMVFRTGPPDQVVIVSHEANNLLYYSANFSFILFFFLLSGLIGYVINVLLKNLYRRITFGKRFGIRERFSAFWQNLSFRIKVLASITVSMSLALVFIGFATVKYISYRYNKDELTRLEKKTRAIAAKLEGQLHNEELAEAVPDDLDILTNSVKNLANVYQTDITVFNVHGNLLASSQPLIYDKGIIEVKMHPRAYLEFTANLESQLIQEEKIGKLNYIAAYVPIRSNFESQTIAYLSLPYFSREKELNDAIASFLVALINLYMLLFLVLLIISVLISNTLTAPLNIIRKHLRTTSLTQQNELITWENNDEIGKLVKEYNTMVRELAESAQRLAQSEREGAWKEMAKQVAHEIKNPLTPMKLKIQQLQMAYIENSPRFEAMFEKVTLMLIQQIDELSRIANEFSAFAKMPHENPEKVNINEIVQHAAELFGNTSEADIYVKTEQKPLYALIDPNQFGRALNNLIKNSIQAVPESRRPQITLITRHSDHKINIEIRDNGSGIPADLQHKIFIPNFSTKSSGMGLGLAIVKNIIDKAGGEIRFETLEGEGTTFFITLGEYGNGERGARV